MKYREQLSVILMRDNGPRRSFRLRRSRFFALLVFFASMPVLCGLLAWQCWLLWEENTALRENVQRFETDSQTAQARAERLETLEALLAEEGVHGRELVLRRLAGGHAPEGQEEQARDGGHGPEAAPGSAGEQPALSDGPGHEEFPAIDTGRVRVSNVQARALHGNTLRIGLDLRNPENQKLLAGTVTATLVTAAGQRHELAFDPEDVGNFRISRFKRSVMVARVPEQFSLVNAQVILEVRDTASHVIYRNIFAVER